MSPTKRIAYRAVRILTAAGAVFVCVLASEACSMRNTASRTSTPSAQSRLAAADALVRAGCFDCLSGAFAEYNDLRSIPSVSRAASIGAIRTAALLAIREREMGALDGGYLTRARQMVVPDPTVQRELGLLLDIADTLPVRREGLAAPDEMVELRRMQTATRNRDAWIGHLGTQAADDALSAYLWLAFNCAYVPTAEHAIERWRAAVSAWQHTPLLAFKVSTCGLYPDAQALNGLLEADPRFLEIHYFLGFAHALTGQIDEAIAHRLEAYRWQPRWPALTHALGLDHMAVEEFDRAIDFLEQTLDLMPKDPNATLNKAKALTYATRFLEALTTLDALLPLGNAFAGEARYWRALNEFHLGRTDEAWADIELAATMLQNAAVPKLAGLIAYRRGQLKESRNRFELAWERNRHDCETGYNLGAVTAELTWWQRTSDVLPETIQCFETREVTLNREIGTIRASSQPLERRERQISRREAEIANNRRLVVMAAYNTAVSYFNLARKGEAVPFAERIIDDEQFGGRARALLDRIDDDEPR
jgi:tetratricopeptide (TPR) repeat protein